MAASIYRPLIFLGSIVGSSFHGAERCCRCEKNDPTLRLYAIIRGDLEMSSGKLAAQAGHAFLDAFLQCHERDPPIARTYLGDGHGTKIALVAPTLDKLLWAYEQAQIHNISCALIADSGHIHPPHFDGSPVITALGIGPITRDRIKFLTKHFALVR